MDTSGQAVTGSHFVPVVADVEGGGEAVFVFFEAADAGFEGLAFGALGPKAEGHGWMGLEEGCCCVVCCVGCLSASF